MENFRELEKEFKKKQFSKKALQGGRHNKGGAGRGSSDEDGSDGSGSDMSDYNDEDDGSDGEDGENTNEEYDAGADQSQVIVEELSKVKKEVVEEDSPMKRQQNQEYLTSVREKIKTYISRIEQELEVAKNKKVKGGGLKKHKEKVAVLTTRLMQTRKYRDRLDEFLISMDYVETVNIKNLMVLLDQQMADCEEVNVYALLDEEFPKVHEVIE